MIDYGRLYRTGTLVSAQVRMHQIAMCYCAGGADAGQLTTVRGNLNYTILESHAVALSNISKYLLAQNPQGWEVYIKATGQLRDCWDEIMSKTVGPVAPLTGTALQVCIDWANVIFADLNPRLDAVKPIFIGGHSVCGPVARIVAEKLRLAGKQVRQVYTSGCPRWHTEDMASSLLVPALNSYATSDPFKQAPPSYLWFTFYGLVSNPTFPELMNVGRNNDMYDGPNTLNINAWVLFGDNLNWPNNATANAIGDNGISEYVRVAWNNLRQIERRNVRVWRDTLNAIFGLGLPAFDYSS